MKDRYSYIAIFSYDDDGINIRFPDLPGCFTCSEKDDNEEAIYYAKDVLGLFIYGLEKDNEPIPSPTPINKITLEKNEVPVLIDVYMPAVRAKIKDHFVKKTLSIPAYLNAKAIDMGINFSQVLQEALKEKIEK